MNVVPKRTSRFIGLALAESARSTYDRVRIGAVIVNKNYPVGQGANLSTSHPMQYYWNKKVGRVAPRHCLHAEMHALVRSKDYGSIEGCEIYIARLDRRGRLAMCRPCDACMAALSQAGIARIIYTTTHGIRTESLTKESK